MDTRKAYDLWAAQYDTNKNRTRDLEGLVLRNTLRHIPFSRCLEIGCGTGKNTEWLVTQAKHVTAVDLSDEMLATAKQKVLSDTVEFVQADITKPWTFSNGGYDLVTFSLVLEHIENLDSIFEEVSKALRRDGHVYLGELHPYKQYTGTKARFDTAEGRHVVECFNHHVSDFIVAAKKAGLAVVDLDEHFDDNNRTEMPRILSIIFRKL